MKKNCYDASYGPIEDKTFRSVLMSFLLKEFPQMGGEMIMELFIDKMESIINEYYPSTERLKMGQLLWFAVAKDDKPGRGKTMKNTKIVPVVLNLCNNDDLSMLRKGISLSEIMTQTIARLYQEADQQGATLAQTDIAIMLKSSTSTISRHTIKYEKLNKTILPRRGTIHDLGRSMSHKTLICKKRKIDGISTSDVAKETSHSPEAVDRYTLNLDRVRFCLNKNLTISDASFVTGISKSLIIEYKNLADEIKKAEIKNQSDNIDFDNIPF